MGRYYVSKDYISHTNASAGVRDWLYQWLRRRTIRGKHKLIATHQSRGKVLDVGCGTGEFLGYLKSFGYQTQGVEPSLAARELAIANHALDVVPDIDRVPATEQFQVITMWHVLEHVHDVPGTLKKLHARMSAGGLLVAAVPDRESWDAEHYGEYWAAYDVPRHLSHFRRKDLTNLLSGHGFAMLAALPMWLDAPYVCMLSERYRGASPLGALFKGALMGALSNAHAAVSSRPTSSSLFVAKKS